jgi:hypothetical protein
LYEDWEDILVKYFFADRRVLCRQNGENTDEFRSCVLFNERFRLGANFLRTQIAK